MNNEEFEDLVNQYCDGTISNQNAKILENVLLKDQQRRNYFNSFMNLDAGLKEEAESEPTEIAPVSSIKFSTLISIAAIILLAINLAFLNRPQEQKQVVDKNNEPLQTSIAIITKVLATLVF